MKKIKMRIIRQGIKLSNGAKLIPFADVIGSPSSFFNKHCYVDNNVRNNFMRFEEEFEVTHDLYILKDKGNKIFHNLILMPIGYSSARGNSICSFAFVVLNKRSREQVQNIKRFFENGGVYKPSIQSLK